MASIRDIMSTDVKTVTLKDNVFEIATLMKQNDIGFVPVVEGRKLIGVVTDRDLVVRGYAEKRSGSASVEEVITRDVATVSPDASVDEAAKLMAKEKVRRLPVVDNGELVGVVALADLAVRESSDEKAGRALSEISENVDHAASGR
ncbi:CBS domain-containing protein [Paenibacillus thermoaerophilus]|nr:CBS domain-containing protein [Paenibacillus thermoaerophilus]TMV19128.1 CBS domain-containing protein [Paenibacillus thermoaerophilus]